MAKSSSRTFRAKTQFNSGRSWPLILSASTLGLLLLGVPLVLAHIQAPPADDIKDKLAPTLQTPIPDPTAAKAPLPRAVSVERPRPPVPAYPPPLSVVMKPRPKLPPVQLASRTTEKDQTSEPNEMRRLDESSEEQLRHWLVKEVEELDVDSVAALRKSLLAQPRRSKENKPATSILAFRATSAASRSGS